MLGPVYANENQESRKQISKSLRQVSAPNFLEAHYTRERSNAKANKTCTTKNHVELFGSNSLYIKYYNDIFFFPTGTSTYLLSQGAQILLFFNSSSLQGIITGIRNYFFFSLKQKFTYMLEFFACLKNKFFCTLAHEFSS